MISDSPFFSVVIPNFNHGSYLKDSIDSVLNQDFKDWELLIIDNYSTDNSDEVISSYNDSRIRVFKIKNKGVIAKSRNLGIKYAKAKWIAFLDSDDIWYFNKFSFGASWLFSAAILYMSVKLCSPTVLSLNPPKLNSTYFSFSSLKKFIPSISIFIPLFGFFCIA